jgi:5-methylcytosine-specific restriction endonuclease McrA
MSVEDVTTQDVQTLLKKFNYRCAYCGTNIAKNSNTKRHLDHVVPISKNGKHCVSNLVPTCDSCNLCKNAKLLQDWYPKQSFYTFDRYYNVLYHIGDFEKLNQLVEDF